MVRISVGVQYRAVLVMCLVGALLSVAGPVLAGQTQQGASIVGQVTDESGAVVPGVTVNVSSPALQQQMTEVTDAAGEYRVTPLPVGSYTVVYSLTGFSTVRREGVVLTIGFVAKLDVRLKLSTVEEAITVTGASPI